MAELEAVRIAKSLDNPPDSCACCSFGCRVVENIIIEHKRAHYNDREIKPVMEPVCFVTDVDSNAGKNFDIADTDSGEAIGKLLPIFLNWLGDIDRKIITDE
jgi:hypothetical protein